MEGIDPPIETERIYDGEVVNLRVSRYRRPDGVVVRVEHHRHARPAADVQNLRRRVARFIVLERQA